MNDHQLKYRIQKAGKGLVLIPGKQEIGKRMSELSLKGLILVIHDAESVTKAREIIKEISELTK